jgi:hypothetical protein
LEVGGEADFTILERILDHHPLLINIRFPAN